MKHLHPKAVILFTIQTFIYPVKLVILMIIPAFVLLINAEVFGRTEGSVWLVALGYILLYLAIFIIGSYIYARLAYRLYKYELRDDVFYKERGIIWKRYTVIPYERIQNIDIHRGIFDRMLGLSQLQIQTAGMSMPTFNSNMVSEAALPGLSIIEAEQLRDNLIARAKNKNLQSPGL